VTTPHPSPQHARAPRDRRGRRRRRGVAALLALGLALPVGAAATTAAWSDDAAFSASVSAAPSWPTTPGTPAPIVTACVVYSAATDQPTGESCSASADVVRVWDPAPTRYAQVDFEISPQLAYDRYARLTFDLGDALDRWVDEASAPAWSWATSDLTANWPVAGFESCDTLPVFDAWTYTGAGSGSIQVNEDGVTAPGHCPA